ncbi:MAG: hypothetical protein AB1918_08485, partial [Pseudomonadota bacterium]
ILLLSAATLTGCTAYETNSQLVTAPADPVPVVTNDGFYDGGVFDQDLLNPEPGEITREPL